MKLVCNFLIQWQDPLLKIRVIIAFPQADGVLPTDMKDSKTIESGRANALEMFLTKVEGKTVRSTSFDVFVFLISLRTAVGVTLHKASSISSGVKVGSWPLYVTPTEPTQLFSTVALSKSSVSSLPLASLSGEIPLE